MCILLNVHIALINTSSSMYMFFILAKFQHKLHKHPQISWGGGNHERAQLQGLDDPTKSNFYFISIPFYFILLQEEAKLQGLDDPHQKIISILSYLFYFRKKPNFSVSMNLILIFITLARTRHRSHLSIYLAIYLQTCFGFRVSGLGLSFSGLGLRVSGLGVYGLGS